MKIAYITDQVLPQNATDTEQIMNMVSAFGKAGCEVSLVAPARHFRDAADKKVISEYYQVDPVFNIRHVYSLYPSIRGVEKAAHAAAGLFVEEAKQADVLYTRNIPVLVAALKLGDKPVVYETYRPWPRQKQWMGGLFNWINRQPNYVGSVLHSKLAADSYQNIGIPADKLLVAHNGYDPGKVEPSLDKEDARKRLGLPQERKIVTYAGHISLAKGIGLILDMADALPETDFVLVGSRERGHVEKRAESMANVRVVPWQRFSNTVPYLYASDVLLIPPASGPLEKVGNTVLPIKTFLYMAMGRAIFGPDSPDLREVLADNDNARLVQPDNISIAIEALRELLSNDDKLLNLGLKAKEDAKALTWDNRAKNVLDFIRRRLDA